METKKPEYVIRVTTEESKPASWSSSYHTYHLHAQIFERRTVTHSQLDDSIQGCTSYPDNPAHLYHGLDFSSLTFSDDKRAGNLFEMKYSAPSSVDAIAAERMFKTLTRLQKALERIYEAEGHAASFGQSINRLARIIGAKYIMTPCVFDPAVKVSGQRYDWTAPGTAVYRIDNLTVQWQNSLQGAAQNPETVSA